MRRADYPPNWGNLRDAVRFRSGDRCEHPGEADNCDAPHGARIHRLREDPAFYAFCTQGQYPCHPCSDPDWRPAITVVLTVAHTCQDTHCDDLEHLRHWCQLHHNRFDMAMRQEHAKATRERTRAAQRAFPGI